MQRSSPFDSGGLRMLAASIVPPEVAPAPMMLWISSMNRTASLSSTRTLSTALSRSSKSPR